MAAPAPSRVRTISKKDPACAICHEPPESRCECEANALQDAINQAEDAFMADAYRQIRQWVSDNAKEYILDHFRSLSAARNDAHTANMERIKAKAFYYRHGPPTQQEIAEAEFMHQRGVDEDWKASVERYPEVLGYYYSLVNFRLPSNDDPVVVNPPIPLSTPPRRKKTNRRASFGGPPPAHPPGYIPGGPPPIPGVFYTRPGATMRNGASSRPPIAYRYSSHSPQGQHFPPY
ncbi:hypothetical protein VHEMI03641 [[Torrubiella] hemipterigena]|uniref:Uncharacterized protein n=1 Tax=[Torrubiella] hemipterigena TaxID=1531966 RepID=A0A0A1TBY5_9HYPO|nr:hypothetical protein VHEMI03641 [[Torrubiella] hemipterigena]